MCLVFAIVYYIFGDGRASIKDSRWVNVEDQIEDYNYNDLRSGKRS